MQRISFAPVLSATLSRDSCWIIGYLLLSHRFSPPYVGDEPGGTVGSVVGAYLAFSRTSTMRQRLVADSGLVSMIRTRSPVSHWLVSSWALSLRVRRSTLPYSAGLTRPAAG